MLDVDFARRQMIEQQVRAWDVLDLAVLETMSRVPREEFAPPAFRELAFADMNVPLGHGQHMLTPKLEGALARSVTSLECFGDLAATARTSILRTGVTNVSVEVADAFSRDDLGRYDVVVLTGSLPLYDSRFEEALNDGGRLFAVVGRGQVMEALRITRSDPGAFLRESLFETVLDPLIHAAEPPRFVF
jgi:protein-L-isoaspartate(D-aspartate) O-methyltransferase